VGGDDFGEWIRSGVEQVRRKFTEPDAEWETLAFVERMDGERSVYPVYGDPNTELADALLAIVAEESGAQRVGFVFAAWKVTDHLEADSVAEDPRRVEIVCVYIIGRESVEYRSAPVYRDGEQPPALGEWSEPVTDVIGGRFARLQSALN
jgi:hypothetical protein